MSDLRENLIEFLKKLSVQLDGYAQANEGEKHCYLTISQSDVISLVVAAQETCLWKYFKAGFCMGASVYTVHTQCGVNMSGDLLPSGVKYCPYCGRPIEEKK